MAGVHQVTVGVSRGGPGRHEQVERQGHGLRGSKARPRGGSWTRAVSVGMVVLSAWGVAASGAVAAPLDPGLWWFDRGNFQAAQDAGFDGSGVTIAVIDSQINPDVVGLRGANLEVVEPSYCHDASGQPYPATSTDYYKSSHGTNVASMILGTGEAPAGGSPIKGSAPGSKVLFYNGGGVRDGVLGGIWEDTDEECLLENGDSLGEDGRTTGMGRAISDAVDAGADIISISVDGATNVSDEVAKAHAAGVIVLGAMSNDSGISGYPAALNGVVAVQAFGEDRHIQTGWRGTPNQSDEVTIAGPGLNLLLQGTENSWDEQQLGSGTSFATPIVAGMLATAKQKYPEATGPQLIQSLLHNTGTKGEHEPEWNSSTGYGAASLTGMLAVDPTTYPNVNPLFDADDPTAIPAQWDVDEAAAALNIEAPSPTATPDTSTPHAEREAAPPPDTQVSPASTASFTPWLIGGGAIAALLIVCGATLAIHLTKTSRRHRP